MELQTWTICCGAIFEKNLKLFLAQLSVDFVGVQLLAEVTHFITLLGKG